MGRAELGPHVLIVLAAGVLVPYADEYRRSEGAALEHARENLSPVGLLALGDDAALARTAPVQLGLDVVDGQLQARRAAVHDDANCVAVGLTPRRYPEHMAKGVAHLFTSPRRSLRNCSIQ